MENQFTVPEKILLCAAELDSEKGTFTAEDLVVRCWSKYPETFGLQGYSDKYPDSNRILTNIMGGKGLRGKGWLRKVGEKRYHITEAGRQAATIKSNSFPDYAAEKRATALGREAIEIIARLIESRALQKYKMREDLTFGDLCSFWNISPRSNSYQLNIAIKDSEASLIAAESVLDSRGIDALILPGRSIPVSRSELALARVLQNHLKERFWQELDVIRERSDERLRR